MPNQLTDEIALRPYDAQTDAQTIASLAGKVWRGAGSETVEETFGKVGGRPWRDWLADDILSYLAADGCRAYVAVANEQIVGFCSYVIDETRSRGTVGYNAVAPDFQGKRLGSAMLKFVLDQIKQSDMEYAAVIVADNDEHEPARRMYERHGFCKMSKSIYMMQKLDNETK